MTPRKQVERHAIPDRSPFPPQTESGIIVGRSSRTVHQPKDLARGLMVPLRHQMVWWTEGLKRRLAVCGHRPSGNRASMDKRLIRVSKYLAKYLRHALHELGLTLQPGGWVPVDDLLAAAGKNGFPITYDELVECVETNDKQRFAFDVSGELIRANQGHSVEVDLQLEQREPPETLYHGTVERFLTSILESGLVRGKRHHVHLSKDVETARKVGSRRGKPIILTVDAGRMHRDGHTFYLSANGVWLTDTVPPDYLAKM